MMPTSASSAREFGRMLALRVISDAPDKTYQYLAPVLAERMPFRLLDLIGEALAVCPTPLLDPFLDEIASRKTIGGWTVIASAVRERIPSSLEETLEHARAYIIQADIWYACDCFGERVFGQALVDQFQPSLLLLSPWRGHENHWVRRVLGVAGHLWAKRVRGKPELRFYAEDLLAFYAPLLGEKQNDAAKGIGWAFKTLGRYYPESVCTFLSVPQNKPIAAVIHRKALKFLPEEMKAQLARKPV